MKASNAEDCSVVFGPSESGDVSSNGFATSFTRWATAIQPRQPLNGSQRLQAQVSIHMVWTDPYRHTTPSRSLLLGPQFRPSHCPTQDQLYQTQTPGSDLGVRTVLLRLWTTGWRMRPNCFFDAGRTGLRNSSVYLCCRPVPEVNPKQLTTSGVTTSRADHFRRSLISGRMSPPLSAAAQKTLISRPLATTPLEGPSSCAVRSKLRVRGLKVFGMKLIGSSYASGGKRFLSRLNDLVLVVPASDLCCYVDLVPIGEGTKCGLSPFNRALEEGPRGISI